ncbi:MAG: cysteine--tRNA ligase [Pseudomonadota bacterium]
MTLTLFDTQARETREFEPADPERVTMYVCGPTVYNHAHIGNFRAAVVFDLLFRLLRNKYGADHVVYARNITDIDDKIIAAARETGNEISAITRKFTDIYRQETAAFNVLSPTLEPHATDHIKDMIALVSRLIEKGAAYAAEGHVLFSVDAFAEYGGLAKVDQDEMVAGARVEVAPYKRNPSDFVLWKPSADDEPGWRTPDDWGIDGRGRPGWHLECSAMIKTNLGNTIDIHGGGLDLRFPHHENEVAQSCCANGTDTLARYWVHNGFLSMGSEKMSKSLGNIVLPKDLLKERHGEVLRWALLSAHYRQPLEWREALLDQTKKQLDRFYRLFLELKADDTSDPDETLEVPRSIILALENDMNTPEAFAGLHELRDIAVQLEGAARIRAIKRMRVAGQLMGFFEEDPEAWFRGVLSIETDDATRLSASDIDRLLQERARARAEKNFARADEIRDRLSSEEIIIEDGPHGATWRRK